MDGYGIYVTPCTWNGHIPRILIFPVGSAKYCIDPLEKKCSLTIRHKMVCPPAISYW